MAKVNMASSPERFPGKMPLLLCPSVVTTIAGVADPGTAVNDRAHNGQASRLFDSRGTVVFQIRRNQIRSGGFL
jgi:hypothetical protein